MACFKVYTLFIMIAALQEACGLPLADQPEFPTDVPTQRHVRTKRCSCNNWEDKECIYFCHLDIIWVNTPSKLLPYGLGSPLSRRRRSAERCECRSSTDKTCHDFCRKSSDDGKDGVISQLTDSPPTMLETLRTVVKTNLAKGKILLLQKRTSLEHGKVEE